MAIKKNANNKSETFITNSIKISKIEKSQEKKAVLQKTKPKSKKTSKENLKQLLVLQKINKHQKNLNLLIEKQHQSVLSFNLTTKNLQKSKKLSHFYKFNII